MRWIIGLLVWAGLAAFFVLLTSAARLGGKRDPRRLRLVERNRRTVKLWKKELALEAAYASGAEKVNRGLEEAEKVMKRLGLAPLQDPLGMDPGPPAVVCLDCLWRGDEIPKGWKCEDCGSVVRLWSEV